MTGKALDRYCHSVTINTTEFFPNDYFSHSGRFQNAFYLEEKKDSTYSKWYLYTLGAVLRFLLIILNLKTDLAENFDIYFAIDGINRRREKKNNRMNKCSTDKSD